MKQKRYIVAFVLTASVVLGTTSELRALPPASAPGELRQSLSEAARAEFDEGTRLYRESRFADARDAFIRAQVASGDPRVLYNVAVCEKALGQRARAITTLKRSLLADRSNNAAYKQLVDDTIAVLSPYVGFLLVTASVSGAVLTVDGEVLSSETVPVDPGEHTIGATKEGYEPASVVTKVAAGETARVTIPMVLAPMGIANVSCNLPRCMIQAGDDPAARSPVTLKKPTGSYVVRASVDGRIVAEQRVELVDGRRIDVELVPFALTRSHLRVTTDRGEDMVTVDGKPVGQSGVDVELTPGEHRVFIARPGGASRQIDVLLREGETRDLRVTLEEKKGVSAWWFVGAGVLVAAGVVTTAALLSSGTTSTTRFEGSGAGTLNPYVVPARFGGGQ